MALQRPNLKADDNAERWLVSYADFMTLLFGFFVVMYAISSVNEAKYEILSSTLNGVFQTEPASVDPVQIGDPIVAPGQDPVVVEKPRDLVPDAPAAVGDSVLDQMAAELANELSGLLDNNSLSIKGNEHWLEISLDSEVLFGSGSAVPVAGARGVLADVALVLVKSRNPVTVEGYTDNQPIQTTRYPSNWELSAARAAAVVRLLADAGLAGDRLAAVGYGPHSPIASNRSAEGRRKNRRVVLVVSRDAGIQKVVAANGEPVIQGALATGTLAAEAPANTISDGSTDGGPDPAAAAGQAMLWLSEDDAEVLPGSGDSVRAVRQARGGILFTNE